MIKIAYLGIPGSYSFAAAQKYFGQSCQLLPAKSVKEVFKKIADKSVDAAVVPLENTTTGSIAETYDLLLESKLSITGEIILRVRHQLLANTDKVKLENIKYCYSHPQAILQCETFLSNYPEVELRFTSDTATAAKVVSQRKKLNEIAIAGIPAAKFYGLKITEADIEDNKHNFTRFVVISPKPNKKGNKISIAFSVAHVPGSLFRSLKAYAQNNLNMTDIESRPLYGKPWEYIFYVDFEVNNQERELTATLSAMKENCHFLTVLGRYKKGKIYEA